MTDSTLNETTAHSQIRALRSLIVGTLQFYLTIAVPVLLTLAAVRFVMTPVFLQLEYNRPDFPEDDYGFTTEDRLEYAPYALTYLLNDSDISYLGNLTFPNGQPLYTTAELHHMEDVKLVTRVAFFVLLFGGIFTIGSIGYLWTRNTPQSRQLLQRGLRDGALLTLGIIGFIIIIAIVAWDLFFDMFHGVLFESGTWRFAYSDTLIRLFPEQFWFDAAIVIGGLTGISATVILLVTGRAGQSSIHDADS